jgi:hypothetical protein
MKIQKFLNFKYAKTTPASGGMKENGAIGRFFRMIGQLGS